VSCMYFDSTGDTTVLLNDEKWWAELCHWGVDGPQWGSAVQESDSMKNWLGIFSPPLPCSELGKKGGGGGVCRWASPSPSIWSVAVWRLWAMRIPGDSREIPSDRRHNREHDEYCGNADSGRRIAT